MKQDPYRGSTNIGCYRAKWVAQNLCTSDLAQQSSHKDVMASKTKQLLW